MFWAGCGADQNPLPRRTVELAEKYGRQMAASRRPGVGGRIDADRRQVWRPAMPRSICRFDRSRRAKSSTRKLGSNDKYQAARAKMLLAELDGGKPLSPTYPYPVSGVAVGRRARCGSRWGAKWWSITHCD